MKGRLFAATQAAGSEREIVVLLTFSIAKTVEGSSLRSL